MRFNLRNREINLRPSRKDKSEIDISAISDLLSDLMANQLVDIHTKATET